MVLWACSVVVSAMTLLQTGQATILRQPEQITKTGAYARMSALLERASEAGGLLLCDDQTFGYLGQEFKGWTPISFAAGGHAFTLLRHGDRRVIVAQDIWRLGRYPKDGGRGGLASLLKSVADACPDLRLMARDDLWFACGGWDACPKAAFAQLNAGAAQDAKFLLDAYSGKGFCLLRLVPASYLRAVQMATVVTKAEKR